MSRLAVTMLRATALVSLAAFAAGCQSDPDGAGEPAAVSPTTAPATPTDDAEPSSSGAGTAANTDKVCRAVDKLLLAGSKKLAADSATATREEETGEQLEARLKGTLDDLADDVRAQAKRAEDGEIEALLTETAKQLDAGARSSDPVKWLSSTFVDIPPKVTRDCHV
jgi:hypothetical protein